MYLSICDSLRLPFQLFLLIVLSDLSVVFTSLCVLKGATKIKLLLLIFIEYDCGETNYTCIGIQN